MALSGPDTCLNAGVFGVVLLGVVLTPLTLQGQDFQLGLRLGWESYPPLPLQLALIIHKAM